MSQFEFEKLEVYQLALSLGPLVRKIACQLPRGYADLRSHATRSERSIRLNIAEGAGRDTPASRLSERMITLLGGGEGVRGVSKKS